MGLTVLTQTAKGLLETIGEGEEQPPLRSEVLKALESNKWYLWHGKCFRLFNICSLWRRIWEAHLSAVDAYLFRFANSSILTRPRGNLWLKYSNP
jgi:hypothetical protein